MLEKLQWAEDLIGKPWVNGARGPDAFDCWGLVWWIYSKYVGVTLPLYPTANAKDYLNTARLILQETKTLPTHLRNWHELGRPDHYCAVTVGASNSYHVGVYIDVDGGLILHSVDRRGVMAQSISALKTHCRLKFYRWQPLSK